MREGAEPVQEIADRQTVLRLPPAIATGSPRLTRILRLPRWYASVFRRFRDDTDIAYVHCHGLASLPISVALKLTLGVPLLYDAHELESLREGWSKSVQVVAGWVERGLMRFVDHTIVVGDFIRRWYHRAYPRVPVDLIRNIPDQAPDAGSGLPSGRLREAAGLSPNDELYVYVGALAGNRGIDRLIEVFERLPADKHIAFVGFGEMAELARAAAARAPNIHFFEPVPATEVVSFIRGCDAGIIYLVSNALSYRYAMPNKLFEYTMAGLRVISNDGPEMKDFIETHDLGWTFDGTNDGLEHLLKSLTRADLVKPRIGADLPTWSMERIRLVGILRSLISTAPRNRRRITGPNDRSV